MKKKLKIRITYLNSLLFYLPRGFSLLPSAKRDCFIAIYLVSSIHLARKIIFSDEYGYHCGCDGESKLIYPFLSLKSNYLRQDPEASEGACDYGPEVNEMLAFSIKAAGHNRSIIVSIVMY